MKVHDISVLIHEKMLLYPGDKSIVIHQVKKVDTDDWNLSNITMSSHLGTHVDSPHHLMKSGRGIDQLEIEKFMGKAKVITLMELNFGEKITMQHLRQYPIQHNDIILFKTKNSTVLNKEYHSDAIELTIEGAQYMVDLKVKAVAIDYLSIGSREVHEVLLKNEILVYETVDLTHIEAGNYFFIGLPLKIPTEGCPVRAILIENF